MEARKAVFDGYAVEQWVLQAQRMMKYRHIHLDLDGLEGDAGDAGSLCLYGMK